MNDIVQQCRIISVIIYSMIPTQAPKPLLLLLLLLFLFPPSLLHASEWEPAEEGAPDLHSQCWSLGGTIGRVQGLSGNLGRLAGPDDGVIMLEVTQNDYLSPYTSREFQIGLNLFNNFSMLQGAFGYRLSTVPFPKVFIRPWVGAYLTINLLEDTRDYDEENEEYDGTGVGLAAALGVTMRLCRKAALEVAAKGDQIFTLGWLETDEFFAEEFRISGVYIRFIYLFK
jgi:hypothetical protein